MKSLLRWNLFWDEVCLGIKSVLGRNLPWDEIWLGMESALGFSQAADSGDKFTSLVRTFTITGIFSWGFEVHALGEILNFPTPCVLLNRCWTAVRPLIQNRNSLSSQSFQGFFSRISPNVIRNMRWPHPWRVGHGGWVPQPRDISDPEPPRGVSPLEKVLKHHFSLPNIFSFSGIVLSQSVLGLMWLSG